MQTDNHSSIQGMLEAYAPQTLPIKRRSDPAQWVVEVGSAFPPLELETRPTVSTAAAAFYLRKATQTMRIYACKENGPLRPIRVGAHLHWKTEDIRRLLGVA